MSGRWESTGELTVLRTVQARCYKMAAHGAALQSQNNELVKCIEDLKEKRELLARSIREDEAEKSKIQQDLQVGIWSSRRQSVTATHDQRHRK
jgi:hypothetical protein